MTSTSTTDSLRAIYYPFSRCLDETTLKRAIVLYDHLMFVDPKTPKVRAGLYSVSNHQPYLPDKAAQQLADDWQEIEDRYDLLLKEEVISFFDPAHLLAEQSVDALITDHLQKDMADHDIFSVFDGTPRSWSILRSRIPKSAFKYLHHQYTPRVLYDQNIRQAFISNGGQYHALFADGKPTQDYSLPGYGSRTLVNVPEEYACVVPYYLGSSLAVSLALAACADTGAIPFTDSARHHRLLASRYRRTAERRNKEIGGGIPGLVAEPTPGRSQQLETIQLRLFDSVLSKQDLDNLTIEDCLEYRSRTQKERRAFRSYVVKLTDRARAAAWSPDFEHELKAIVEEARKEIESQRAALLDAHWKIFHKAAIGVAVGTVPTLVATVFPAVSPAAAFIFGAGLAAGELKDSVKELAELWIDRLTGERNAMAYLYNLKA